MFKGVSFVIAILGFCLVSYSLFAAEFDVGDSNIKIEKVRGSVTLNDNGRSLAGSSVRDSELKPGAYLDLGPNSEVWLKVIKKVSGESSYLRISSTTCGTRCSYNEARGIVSAVSLSDGEECRKSISFLDRAREVAGIQKQDMASVETVALVSFTTDKPEKKGDGLLPVEAKMPPAVSAPTSPYAGGEDRDYTFVPGSGNVNVEVPPSKALNTSSYIPGSSTMTAGGGRVAPATRNEAIQPNVTP
ncbi:MAG: hypothetical protein A3F16_02520 [Deltaproteobacteria bacterium RIFCSPHIGHO2_12_FULL_43_9]|nr:MAG: hypothetical protein A3F16_02520 [Deltaproteobacteria bacterium RIFCSPHIGHO2_12_FULL_43_9]